MEICSNACSAHSATKQVHNNNNNNNSGWNPRHSQFYTSHVSTAANDSPIVKCNMDKKDHLCKPMSRALSPTMFDDIL